MAQQLIDIGNLANDGTGDPLRTAFNKTNQNFTEVYTLVNSDTTPYLTDNITANLELNGSNISNTGIITASEVSATTIRTDSDTIQLGENTSTVTTGITIGKDTQANQLSVTIGYQAGTKHVTNVNTRQTTAIGPYAQENDRENDETGFGAIAIGPYAGQRNQGELAIAIGRFAGREDQHDNSIVLNAGTTNLNTVAESSFYVDPIRNINSSGFVKYNATTKEVSYDNVVKKDFTIITGAAANTAHDVSVSEVFYHKSVSDDITALLTNVNVASGESVEVEFVIDQGATPYIVNSIYIDDTLQSISWQGGSEPTGNANKVDVIQMKILNDSGTYIVLGNLQTYG